MDSGLYIRLMARHRPNSKVRGSRIAHLLPSILTVSLPAAMTIFCLVCSVTADAQEVPSKFTNLQVLPDDITKDELLRTMKLITKSLGTKCDFCHRTDVRDYASDEVQKKVVARRMMRMVQRINREIFTWKGAPKATCFMCHRGQRKPKTEPDKYIEREGEK